MKEYLKISRIGHFICVSMLNFSKVIPTSIFYSPWRRPSWIFSENEYLPWVNSSGLFCVVIDTSKEPISGEIALLTFLSNLSTFLVLIDWPMNRIMFIRKLQVTLQQTSSDKLRKISATSAAHTVYS